MLYLQGYEIIIERSKSVVHTYVCSVNIRYPKIRNQKH